MKERKEKKERKNERMKERKKEREEWKKERKKERREREEWKKERKEREEWEEWKKERKKGRRGIKEREKGRRRMKERKKERKEREEWKKERKKEGKERNERKKERKEGEEWESMWAYSPVSMRPPRAARVVRIPRVGRFCVHDDGVRAAWLADGRTQVAGLAAGQAERELVAGLIGEEAELAQEIDRWGGVSDVYDGSGPGGSLVQSIHLQEDRECVF